MVRCNALRAACGKSAGRQSGFSYLWVLLLVALMGVALSVALEIDSTAVQRDREKELLAIGRQFRASIGSYYEAQQDAGKKEYPQSLQDLLQDQRSPGVRRHLRKIFVDPMTAKPQWGLLRIGGRIVGVHSLSQQASIKRDGFETEEMYFKGKQKYAQWLFTWPFDLAGQIDSGVAPIALGASAASAALGAEPGQGPGKTPVQRPGEFWSKE